MTKICFKSAANNEVPFGNQQTSGRMVKLDKDAIKAIVEAVEAAEAAGLGTRTPSSPSPSPTPAAPPTTPLLRRAVPNGEAHPATNGASEDVDSVDRLDRGARDADRLLHSHAVDAFPEVEGGDARLSINGVSNHCNGNAVVHGEDHGIGNTERPSVEERSPENGHHYRTPLNPEDEEWSPHPTLESGEIALCLARLGDDRVPQGGDHMVSCTRDAVVAVHCPAPPPECLNPDPAKEPGETTLCLARLGPDRDSQEGEHVVSCAQNTVVADATVDGVSPAPECTSPPPQSLPAPPPTPPAVQITNITILVNGVDIETFESGGGGAAVQPLDNDIVVAEVDKEMAQPLPPMPPKRKDSLCTLRSYEEKLESRNRKSNKWQHPKSYHRYRKAAKLEDADEAAGLSEDEVEPPTPTLDAGGRVTEEFVVQLVRFFKRQRRLPSMTVRKILKEAKEHMAAQPSLVEVELGRDDVLNICGDIHGQFYDLARYHFVCSSVIP